MIDIIIPAYNAHETIRRTLYSILIQTMKDDIRVCIVDDCSDKSYKKLLSDLQDLLNIVIIKTPSNQGPGYARQYGIDNTNSEYIVFMDADDILYNSFSIEKLYKHISENNYNVVTSNFKEEYKTGILDHFHNEIWMHGKIYRRSFIEKNNIRFNNTRANEDTGFNYTIALIDEFHQLEEFTYIWKYNEESITRRRNHEYSFSGLEGFIYNVCFAINEGIKRNAYDVKIANMACKSLYEIFFDYLKYKDKDRVDVLLSWCKELKKLYLDYKDKLTEYERNKIIKEVYDRKYFAVKPYDLINNKNTFEEFLNNI